MAARGRSPLEASVHRLLANRVVPVVAYVALFLCLLPTLKTPAYDGHNPLPRAVSDFSVEMSKKVLMAHTWRTAHPEVYRPFAFVEEWRRHAAIRESYRWTERSR